MLFFLNKIIIFFSIFIVISNVHERETILCLKKAFLKALKELIYYILFIICSFIYKYGSIYLIYIYVYILPRD